MKYLTRKWVLVSLAAVAAFAVGYIWLTKTQSGKKMAAKIAGVQMPAAGSQTPTTTTEPTLTAKPAATLAGNVRYQ